jgi:hypothetical protein
MLTLLANLQGSGDFSAQPAKIRPFTTSTGFFQNLTGSKLAAINLDRPISYIFFQVPANFFFIVITTSQELGIDKVSRVFNVAKL